jgi:KGK domain
MIKPVECVTTVTHLIECKFLKVCMKEHFYLENCNDDDVLSHGSLMFKIGRLKEALKKCFANEIPSSLENILQAKMATKLPFSSSFWFNKEQDNPYTWEILRLGANNWQKGKIRIRVSVEFVPDEPENLESSLDDIRQTINHN